MVVAATLATSLPLVQPWLRHRPAAAAAVLAGFAALVTLARWSRSGPALRTALLAVFVHVLALVFGMGIWPAPLLLAVVLLWAAGRLWSPLRPTLAWLHRGHLTADLPWLILGTVLLSGSALTAWALLARPAVSPFLDTLRSMPPAAAVAGILVFALVNSACEEAVFTGAFLHELRSVLDVRIALGVQSLGFGLMHVQGFPSGPVGVALGTVYGVMLGVIRLRSRGMVAPYAAHVIADVTIGVLAVTLL